MDILIMAILSVLNTCLWYQQGHKRGKLEGKKEGRRQIQEVAEYFEVVRLDAWSEIDTMDMLKGRVATDIMTVNRDN